MSGSMPRGFYGTLTKILFLCLSYAVMGRLALLLAIPPGYATAIFPSAGIAVSALLIWGYRLWPGIFLGSFLLNVWISAEQGPLGLTGIKIALAVASGATLQGLAGFWLIKRFVEIPIELTKELDILKFMILAGPLACLLNASFGAGSLYATGIISATEVGYSWFTWWVGDCIGVLIASPLMMILFARPRELWRSRRNSVALPILFAVTLLIVIFIQASKFELESIRNDFKELSSNVHENLNNSIQVYINSIAYLDRFIVSSENVTREEFREFVNFPIKNFMGIHALSWNPVISDAERHDFENSIIEEGYPDFEIKERDQAGNIIRARQRPEYIPVKYIEPMNSNMKAFGFDVASNDIRRAAFEKARDTGRFIATSRIQLVQDNAQQYGFLLFKAAYNGEPKSLEDRKQLLKGVSVGVFRVAEIVDAALSSMNKNALELNVYETGSDQELHLFGSEKMPKGVAEIALAYQLEVGDRIWRVNFWPSNLYLSEHRGWQAWVLLAGGLLFASFLGAFLLSITGRSYQVEKLVDQRTAELSGILNTAIESIIILDANGHIETINPAGELLFGYSANEMKGSSLEAIIPDIFKDSSIPSSSITTSHFSGERRDSYALRKDGSSIDIELAISQVSISDRVLYTVIVHDLTERKKIERMKDEFVSTISHELRTPLTSIKGSLGLVVSGVLDSRPEDVKNMLKVSNENCDRLGHLIDDLLEFNKIQFSGTKLKMQSLSVNTVIEKSVQANQGFASKYRVSLCWNRPETDYAITGDENRLIQVLSNLLSNAVKYSPENEEVTIAVEKFEGRVRISVSDKGVGIPLEFQDKVFDKFTQADSSDTRRVGGTGLGLAIAKSLVELHSGELSFISQPGQGSTFYLDLPLKEGQAGAEIKKV